jgi:hypothetical protein
MYLDHHHLGSVVIMSLDHVTEIAILESQLESSTNAFNGVKGKINKLIAKHQDLADNYHRNAEKFWNLGHFEKSAKADELSHPHEMIAAELRLVLKNVQ